MTESTIFDKRLLSLDNNNKSEEISEKDRILLSNFFKTEEWKKFLNKLNFTWIFDTLIILKKSPQVINKLLDKLKERTKKTFKK